MFKHPTHITSIAKLIQSTIDIFNAAFQEADEGKFTIYSIWTTGEWMFCDEGWAWEEIGNKLMAHMENNLLKMNIILSRTPPGKTLRQRRSEAVLKKVPIQGVTDDAVTT